MTKYAKQVIKWLAISGIIILAVLWMIFSGNGNSSGTLTGEIGANDWIKGNPEAEIVLVEYSDFQCPACANYQPIVRDLVAEFSNHIKFVYRHFPLRTVHPNAQIAAQAAEAAGKQGKFWEMHDELFENQYAWSPLSKSKAEDEFAKYAENLGLNVEQFKQDINSDEVEKAVNDSYKSGEEASVNSTPTFFLNGEKINNPRSLEDFRILIRNTIEGQNT